MNRLLLLFFAICAGAIGFSQLQRSDKATRSTADAREQEWMLATNRMADTQETLMALRAKLSNKKKLLRVALQHAEINPALLQLLEQDLLVGMPPVGLNCGSN